MSPDKQSKNPKLSVRFGALWPLLNEYAKAVKETRVVVPELAVIVREAMEIGLLRMIDRLPAEQKKRILKAKPSA